MKHRGRESIRETYHYGNKLMTMIYQTKDQHKDKDRDQSRTRREQDMETTRTMQSKEEREETKLPPVMFDIHYAH
jgi:hypothetical protein